MPVGLFSKSEIELLTVGTSGRVTLYIIRNDDDMIGVVEKIDISQDADGVDFITISGRDVSHRLADRVQTAHTSYYDDAMLIARTAIAKNCISPEDTDRKFDNSYSLELGEYLSAGTKIYSSFFGKDMYTLLQETCQEYSIGFKMVFDKPNSKFILENYRGKSKTGVTFSTDYRNLFDVTCSQDAQQYANVAFIAGEGEGVDRVTKSVPSKDLSSAGGKASGENRKEIYIDARNVRKEAENESGEAVTLSDDEYSQMLSNEARTELATEHSIEKNFECSVSNVGQFVYGIDYSLGDIVKIEPVYGEKTTARIIGVTESFDESGHTVLPELKIN